MARAAAVVALLLGLAHATVSAVWALGGTWLLNTVGGGLEELGRRGGTGVRLLLWTVVVAKVVGAVLPGLVLLRGGRRLRALAWVEAVVLAGYGGVLTVVGLVVQSGVVPLGPVANPRALAWHAYLWDPWFLLWGLAVLVVLLRTRRRSRHDGAA